MSITERARRGISFAFQQPVRFKGITVFDLISIASGKKLSTNEACTYLSEVGLCARDYVNREVNASLSGGELKRIEIATMLARGTKMSIFDEPEAKHRPLELPEPHQRVREDARDDPRQHPHHLAPGAHP